MTKLPRTLIAISIFALAAGTASAESVTVYTAALQSFMDVLVPEFEAETGLTVVHVEYMAGATGALADSVTLLFKAAVGNGDALLRIVA